MPEHSKDTNFKIFTFSTFPSTKISSSSLTFFQNQQLTNQGRDKFQYCVYSILSSVNMVIKGPPDIVMSHVSPLYMCPPPQYPIFGGNQAMLASSSNILLFSKIQFVPNATELISAGEYKICTIPVSSTNTLVLYFTLLFQYKTPLFIV